MGESNPNYASGEFNFNELSGFDGKHSLLSLLVLLIRERLFCYCRLAYKLWKWAVEERFIYEW